MQAYRKQRELLDRASSVVRQRFPRLGVNKSREIIRLLYEVSKREKRTPEDILDLCPVKGFHNIKAWLIKRRYPFSSAFGEELRPHLPDIRLSEKNAMDTQYLEYRPGYIVIEKKAARSSMAKNFTKAFPQAQHYTVPSLKEYIKSRGRLSIKDYNERKNTAIIVHENYDFFKKCPCTQKAAGCGYNIFNLSFGCIFDCTYCYLQEYVNSPGIIFPANLDGFFKNFTGYKRPGMRIGTGEFSDSLMADDLTGYSLPIIEFFRKHVDVLFEFKTKSDNIHNLLRARHSGNIVVSWSLNPQRIINKNEYFTASLERRLAAARACVKAGYMTGFHFDPVIHYAGWEKEYKKLVDMLFASISAKKIAWISIGTLRFNPRVKPLIEERFPDNDILDSELIPGFDNKLRYPRKLRVAIYRYMINLIRKCAKTVPLYLCMEEAAIWQEAGLNPVNFRLQRP